MSPLGGGDPDEGPEEIEITAEEILEAAHEARVEREQNESRKPENDPTEYLPVMRHHLHEALWVINMARGHVEAQDLATSYHEGLTIPKSSPLARSLDRSHATLEAYLGMRDEEGHDGQQPVSEEQ